MKDFDSAYVWLAYANEDLRSALFLHKELYPKPFEVICYHCQQAAEKALKAFLYDSGVLAPRTHDLTLLSQLCFDIDSSFEALFDMCEMLAPLAVNTRYPNNIEIGTKETEEALASAKTIVDFVVVRCKA